MTCSMTPLYQGNTRPIGVEIVNKETGAPANITGDEVVLTIKENKNDAVPVLQVVNLTHTDPVNGRTDFEITAAQSAAFEIKEHYVDVTWIRTSQNGEVYTLLERNLQILKPVRNP